MSGVDPRGRSVKTPEIIPPPCSMVTVPLSKVLYHFWSSSAVGLLVWVLMSSTEWRCSWMGSDGSTSLTYWRQCAIPLLSAVWAHVLLFDVVEHRNLPGIIDGMHGLIDFLLHVL